MTTIAARGTLLLREQVGFVHEKNARRGRLQLGGVPKAAQVRRGIEFERDYAEIMPSGVCFRHKQLIISCT